MRSEWDVYGLQLFEYYGYIFARKDIPWLKGNLPVVVLRL